jgi:hypothetical protein
VTHRQKLLNVCNIVNSKQSMFLMGDGNNGHYYTLMILQDFSSKEND